MEETNRTPAGMTTAGSREESVGRAFERVSDAPLRKGNRLTLLRNGPRTYDEWLEEIGRAGRWIHLENYIFKADGVGRRFAGALEEKAREGVPGRVFYDWYGSKATPSSLWRELRNAGVDVQVFNPFSLGGPLEVFLRDHRKSLAAAGLVGRRVSREPCARRARRSARILQNGEQAVYSVSRKGSTFPRTRGQLSALSNQQEQKLTADC